MYPLKLKPYLKEVVWGGDRLRSLGKNVEENSRIGESWEISDHENGPSAIANGRFAGRLLSEIIADNPRQILGNGLKSLPLLLKFIDANDRLSVQVHPDNANAQLLEKATNGKTELWIIIEAEPDAQIIYGVKPGVSSKTIEKVLAKPGALPDCLNFIPVRKGDTFYIEAGTVHALLGGTMVLEIQQSSDITYRLYDWERRARNNKPRELHVEKALQVLNFSINEPDYGVRLNWNENRKTEIIEIIDCPYFYCRAIKIGQTQVSCLEEQKLRYYNVIEGAGALYCDREKVPLKKGESILLPAELPQCSLKTEGQMIVIETL